ncbi:tigger transposable element-derived protein 2-like [Diabrotica virgifera virgifera]|uniref:Jerky protein homolog-like n=1 Tax=Diabrotica virgifera virgifera TaxID=50390 RepID=A0ABM5JLE3_DIAVI|nr:tigger transposable element-derived protein 2-like [Diabrotica virgifera virgifera]
MAAKRKNVVVTMEKKLEALGRIDKGESLKTVAASYGVGTSTVSDWKKNRTKIEEFCFKLITKDSLDNRCKTNKAKNETLDDALYVWFCAERERGLPVSGPIIQETALKLNKMLPDCEPNFTASQGWLDRWKKRHGIRQLSITGESLSGDNNAAQDYKSKFLDFVREENLTADQIYNADETGLFYRMLPSKTLASKTEEAAKGYKKSKDRLTIMACSNASGKHKFPLVLIGKSKNPRALKNVNRDSLPVVYQSQKNAWMDSTTFKNWFFDCFVPGVNKIFKRLWVAK